MKHETRQYIAEAWEGVNILVPCASLGAVVYTTRGWIPYVIFVFLIVYLFCAVLQWKKHHTTRLKNEQHRSNKIAEKASNADGFHLWGADRAVLNSSCRQKLSSKSPCRIDISSDKQIQGFEEFPGRIDQGIHSIFTNHKFHSNHALFDPQKSQGAILCAWNQTDNIFYEFGDGHPALNIAKDLYGLVNGLEGYAKERDLLIGLWLVKVRSFQTAKNGSQPETTSEDALGNESTVRFHGDSHTHTQPYYDESKNGEQWSLHMIGRNQNDGLKYQHAVVGLDPTCQKIKYKFQTSLTSLRQSDHQIKVSFFSDNIHVRGQDNNQIRNLGYITFETFPEDTDMGSQSSEPGGHLSRLKHGQGEFFDIENETLRKHAKIEIFRVPECCKPPEHELNQDHFVAPPGGPNQEDQNIIDLINRLRECSKVGRNTDLNNCVCGQDGV